MIHSQKLKRRESKHASTNIINSQRKGKEEKNKRKKKTEKSMMKLVSPYLSIITLSVNKLKYPIERHGVAGEIITQDPTLLPTRESPHF